MDSERDSEGIRPQAGSESGSSLEAALAEAGAVAWHPALASQQEALLQQLRADLAAPWTISQRGKATCAATCAQILLALREPAHYARLVSALASPEGEVGADLIAGGLKRSQAEQMAGDDGSGRSVTSQLLQPALMGYAIGASGLMSWSRGRAYDNTADRHDGRIGKVFPGWVRGLLQAETTHLLNGLFGPGTHVTRIVAVNPGYRLYPDEGKVQGRVKVLQAVTRAVDAGHPVAVGLRWQGELNGQHQILLTRLDSGTGLAYFINPWGELHSMSREQFCRRLTTASLPTRALAPLTGQGDTLARLPGEAGEPRAYGSIAWYRLMSVAEWLATDRAHLPALRGTERRALGRCFRRWRLAPVLLARWAGRLAALSPLQARIAALATLDALRKVRSREQAQALLS